MKDLSELEAERLAIYFEESGAYQHKQMKDAERTSSGSSSENTRTVLELGDDEEEYDE